KLTKEQKMGDEFSGRIARVFLGRRVLVTGMHCFLVTLFISVASPITTAQATDQSPATVVAFNAPYLGSPSAANPAVIAVAAVANGDGYYVLRSNGEVDAYGAPFYGSLGPGSLPLGTTATGIAFDSATGGY